MIEQFFRLSTCSSDYAPNYIQIPETDGRAGMAAIGGVAPGSIDFDDLYTRVCEKLPFYARPLFLRVGSELEITGRSYVYSDPDSCLMRVKA